MKQDKGLPFGQIVLGALRNSWRANPYVFSVLIVGSLLLCTVQVYEIYAMRYFFDTVALFAEGTVIFSGVLRAGVPVAVILVVGPLVNIVEYLAQGYFWRRGSGYLLSLFHLRAGKLRLIDFETTNTFDDMKKAGLGSEDAPAASRTVVQFFFYYLPYFLFTSVFLFTIQPLLVCALLFIFASVLVSQLIRASKVYQFEQRNAGLKRQVEYFEQCITAKEYFKETRTLGAFRYFFARFGDATKRFCEASMDVEKTTARIELLLRAVNVLGYAGILALLLRYVLDGAVSVGAFASVFYSVERMSGILKKMVDEMGEAFVNMKNTSFLLTYLDTPADRLRTDPIEKAADIELKDVCFAYPGGAEVIKHVDLSIPRGETLAIVGENGAGKTTLTKLIVGLYEPTKGTVRFDGRDICAYAPDERFRSISGVFQNFIRYKLSAGENIRVSDMSSAALPDDIAAKAGVHAEKLAEGLDTVLSREYGGTELSGGQWQRVAIARGFYRQHDLIVLDEPTAAIDPIEETNIFRLFKELAQDKTAILVTHRLGSAKIADKIMVLEDGRIVEYGTHAELMAMEGKYWCMFLEQAKWYERQ